MYDEALAEKLKSGIYNISKIIDKTDISRYWINSVKNKIAVPKFVIITLNYYFNESTK